MDHILQTANDENREAWNTNADFWDEKMGEGNDFAIHLCWPAIQALLDPQAGQYILDIACGNGLFSRRLASFGVTVTAFDFSSRQIVCAESHAKKNPHNLSFKVLDATDEKALLTLGVGIFDSALCNMALFDMADIVPLFHSLPVLLKPGGIFVFTLAHPAFNNSSSMHMMEEIDDDGEIKTQFSVKISRYMTPSRSRGLAIRGQPKPQLYFDRPLQVYLNIAFREGFIMDGFEERSFPPDHPQGSPLGWGGKFSEIPPVLAVRMRHSG